MLRKFVEFVLVNQVSTKIDYLLCSAERLKFVYCFLAFDITLVKSFTLNVYIHVTDDKGKKILYLFT